MLPEIKLVISQDNKIIQAVTKQVDTNNFVKTIENFQEVANATLTKMIDDLDSDSGDSIVEEEDDSDPDNNACTNPKRKKDT